MAGFPLDILHGRQATGLSDPVFAVLGGPKELDGRVGAIQDAESRVEGLERA